MRKAGKKKKFSCDSSRSLLKIPGLYFDMERELCNMFREKNTIRNFAIMGDQPPRHDLEILLLMAEPSYSWMW